MPLNSWYQEKFMLNHLGTKLVNMTTDTFNIGLIATGSNSLAARGVTEGYEFVSDLLANNGNALTEVSGGGYSRQGLASVTWTLTGLVITFTAGNPEWNLATFNTSYGWVHDETASSGTDATRPLLLLFDFGGSQTPSAQPFELAVNASGLWTNSDSQ